MLYLACDGDGTGSQVSASIFTGEVKKAHYLSRSINIAGQAVIDHLIKKHYAHPIIQGGDDIMVEIPSYKWSDEITLHIRYIFSEYTGFTMSCGLGDTPQEAAKVLVVAKATGKDRVVYWSPNKQKSYAKAIKGKVEELKMKLKAAGGKVA